jgi:rubrerythrin
MRVMKNEKTLSDLIKGQIKLEKEIAEKLRTLEQRVDSVAARLMIREMQLDTKKHAEILGEALKVIGGPKSFWDYTIHIDADKRAVRKELEEHVKAEEKMMRQIEEEAKKTDDEALKLLLKHFAEDEKKHHKYLNIILSRTYKTEL